LSRGACKIEQLFFRDREGVVYFNLLIAMKYFLVLGMYLEK
jgi:hypothetical protein